MFNHFHQRKEKVLLRLRDADIPSFTHLAHFLSLQILGQTICWKLKGQR